MCSCFRLCSLAQHAKEETEDATSLKKESIKPEPATSGEEEEEEGADIKLSNTTEENNVDAKPPVGECSLSWLQVDYPSVYLVLLANNLYFYFWPNLNISLWSYYILLCVSAAESVMEAEASEQLQQPAGDATTNSVGENADASDGEEEKKGEEEETKTEQEVSRNHSPRHVIKCISPIHTGVWMQG